MLEHRLAETSEKKTESQKLFDAYQEAKRLEREAKRTADELRPAIDELMASGEFVGYPDAYLTLQESVRYDVDQAKAREALGPEVWSRCAEVTGTKLKDALKIGLVTQAEFDFLTTKKVATSLVTKTGGR